MKVLVTGVKGQLGYDVCKVLNQRSIARLGGMPLICARIRKADGVCVERAGQAGFPPHAGNFAAPCAAEIEMLHKQALLPAQDS